MTDKDLESFFEGKIAIKLIDGLREPGSFGNATRNIYRLSPPIEGYDWELDEADQAQPKYELVAVSQANVPFSGPETYIFPCDEDGEIIDFGELPGSRRGSISPDSLMRELGYNVVERPVESDA